MKSIHLYYVISAYEPKSETKKQQLKVNSYYKLSLLLDLQ